MAYKNSLKYGAPVLGVVLLLLAAAWVFGLPPVAALNERADAASHEPLPGENQFAVSPYDLVQVSGVGEASGTPDLANLSLSVTATTDTVAEARNTTAQAAQDVMTALTSNGIDATDVQTSHFRVEDRHNYGSEGRTFVGYEVINGLSVT